MKVSQDEATEKIQEFTDSNIFGTALLFLLITYALEPLTEKVSQLLGKFISKKLGIKVRESVQKNEEV